MKKRIIAWLLGLLTEEGFVFAFGSVWAVASMEISYHNNNPGRVEIRGVSLGELRKLEAKHVAI